MKININIECEPKEITALVLALQERLGITINPSFNVEDIAKQLQSSLTKVLDNT